MLVGNPRFDAFVAEMHAVLDAADGSEVAVLAADRPLLAGLVAGDDWLPEAFAAPSPDHFTQYVLHRDEERGFTVLCVVWDKGQRAIPHDHTVWGLIGQLRGAERTRDYHDPIPGEPLRVRSNTTLRPGDTCVVSPERGDVHDVENAHDGVSVSIHVYDGDLMRLAPRRRRYEAATGQTIPFPAEYR